MASSSCSRPAGSAEAQAAYGQLLKDLAERGIEAAINSAKRRQSVPEEPNRGMLLVDLLLRFATERLPKYKPAERRCIRGVTKIARKLYGETFAEEFDVLRLGTVREAMIRNG
ncbi:MAG: hypothetical protein U0872_02675 [Planctomycetaceae bacterium]